MKRKWISFVGVIFLAFVFVVPDGYSQTTPSNARPFVGFQSIDGQRYSLNGATSNDEHDPAFAVGRQRYAYPGGNGAAAGFQRGQVPTTTSLRSQLTRSDTTTGNINHFGTATAPVASANVRNQGRVLVPYYQSTAQVASRAPQTPAVSRNGGPAVSANGVNSVLARSTATPKLNQPVVQQVSSTVPSSKAREATAVARPVFRTANTTVNANRVVARPPQNCVCAPVNNVPSGLFRQSNVPANQVPAINSTSAAGGYAYQPYQFQPGLGVPQFGRQESVLAPFFRGSGVYTPLLPIFAMPQGTYIGQGIIGQPTAYVNGQPLRNLLRYVFP